MPSMPSDSPEVKELYQRLSHKIRYVARSITEKVQATTQAWDQPISVKLDDSNQTHYEELSQTRNFIEAETQTINQDLH